MKENGFDYAKWINVVQDRLLWLGYKRANEVSGQHAQLHSLAVNQLPEILNSLVAKRNYQPTRVPLSSTTVVTQRNH
jgi:hypothetical protein